MKEKRPIFMRRKSGTLVPVSAIDHDALQYVPEGQEIEINIRRRRSLPHQRRYWLILQKVVEATDAYPSAEHLHESLKCDMGYVRPMRELNGKLRIVPDSTAFEAMDQTEFTAYYERAMARLAEVFGVDPDELLEAA